MSMSMWKMEWLKLFLLNLLTMTATFSQKTHVDLHENHSKKIVDEKPEVVSSFEKFEVVRNSVRDVV